MPSPEYDLRYWEAALAVLEDYLEAPELYWPMDVAPPEGEPDYPQLTLGNMLLARQRLQRPLPLDLAERREILEEKMRGIQHRWRANWERKARREAESRAEMWARYLDDLSESPAEAAFYPTEVRNRTMVDLLLAEGAAPHPPVEVLLRNADERLQLRFQPGDFVWDEELQPAFPKERFWYLYGHPRAS